ncbi:hypothetical protein KXR53_06815 [Inquilinus limosus]|uniref:glycoside hydrolase family 19 protein n=1 Tax=Inquilinus limosus TaxID=171674 RepID=UPI003F18B536
MAINRRFFFDSARLTLFDGRLSPSQVAGLTTILDEWENGMAREDDRWLAYMLGTTHHETGRTMQPVRETFAATDDQAIAKLERAWAAGRLPWVSRPYWRRDANGKTWLGRGYVQLTHKSNYEAVKQLTGIDVVANPDLVMRVDIATKVLFKGMANGLFTGKKLSDYFNPSKEDWTSARRIINGTERAELVASYAKKYYGSISYTT